MSGNTNNNNNNNNSLIGEECIDNNNNTKQRIIAENKGYYRCVDDTNTTSSHRNSNVTLIYRNTAKTKAIAAQHKIKYKRDGRESDETAQKKLDEKILQNGFVMELADGGYQHVQVNEEGNILSRGEIVGEQTTPPTQNNQGNDGGSNNNGTGGNNNTEGGTGGNNNNAGGEIVNNGGGAEEEGSNNNQTAGVDIDIPDINDPNYYDKLSSSNQEHSENIKEVFVEEGNAAMEEFEEKKKASEKKAEQQLNELDEKSANAVASKLEHECKQKLGEENEWLSGKTEEYDQENNSIQNCNTMLQDVINDKKMEAGEKKDMITMLEKRKKSLTQRKRVIKNDVYQAGEVIENDLKVKWSAQKKRLKIGNEFGETPQGAKRKLEETLESVKLRMTLGEDEEDEEDEEEGENAAD